MKSKPETRPVCLEVDLPKERFSVFLPLLQAGVGMKTQAGINIEGFLCDQLNIEPDYVATRILSITLDGKPVDDLAAARIRDGVTLALSSGMPGLVGMTLSRGSILAPFRNAITYRETGSAETRGTGLFRVKLFNLMIRDLGPRFLEKGILLNPSELEGLLPALREAGREIRLDGQPLTSDFKSRDLPEDARVRLTALIDSGKG